MNNQLRKLEEDQNYQLRHWVLLALGDLLILSLLASSGAGYDEYSLLDLYSGFFLLLVLYSENLLLGRVASSSKKAQIFQNILFSD